MSGSHARGLEEELSVPIRENSCPEELDDDSATSACRGSPLPADAEPAWLPPPADLRLTDDEVHLWRATLDQPGRYVRQLAQTLSDDERARAERYHFQRDCRRFIVARGILRAILGCYLGLEPGQVQLGYNTHGKPYLLEGFGCDTLQFNLSHSQGLALYAFTCGRRIGVDVEYVYHVPEADEIAIQFFSPRESAVWQALPPEQRGEALFNCWTRKEAYLKALGDGLAQPLDRFEVSLLPGEPARLLGVAGDPEAAACWSLASLTPTLGYVAALAVEGGGWRLRCWGWRPAP
ncbi:MAG: 4'-phosphopantetheinyl transferase superfamily protein [Anaerolineae bacterium]|nr:MAG: 4'-phosphopantetheinyl transferase superfamily protein [Anaerolineae bacterium]